MTTPPTTWKLTLSYDGSTFHGWQVQPNRPTIQGTLADAIARICGEQVLPQGSGRTDAGVHALAQVASFALAAPIPAANFLRALNRVLPPSIRVLAAAPAPPGFHARHSALGKTYEYRIFERSIPPNFASDRPPNWEPATGQLATETQLHQPAPSRQRIEDGESASPASICPPDRICPPFLAPFAWDCRWPLQLEPMQRAAASLCGEHDFTSFAAADPDLTQRATVSDADPTNQLPHLRAGVRGPRRASSPGWSIGAKVGLACDSTRPLPPEAGSAPNPIKTLRTSTVTRKNDLLIYRVTGTGFLHHMVRNIVGTLVEIGRGSLAADDIPRILAARDRSAAGPTAPACGLFLVSVDYAPQHHNAATTSEATQ